MICESPDMFQCYSKKIWVSSNYDKAYEILVQNPLRLLNLDFFEKIIISYSCNQDLEVFAFAVFKSYTKVRTTDPKNNVIFWKRHRTSVFSILFLYSYYIIPTRISFQIPENAILWIVSYGKIY
jgi:hypothetical protein